MHKTSHHAHAGPEGGRGGIVGKGQRKPRRRSIVAGAGAHGDEYGASTGEEDKTLMVCVPESISEH